MADELGIVMSLYDHVSPTLKDISKNSKAFNKDLEELERSLKTFEKNQDSLVNRSANLKKALEATNLKVKDAQKAYRSLKDETSKGALDEAISEQSKLQQALKATDVALKANNDNYKTLYKSANNAAVAASKVDNKAGDTSDNSGFGKKLMGSGILKMFSASVSEAASAGLSSMVGEPMARMASGIAGGLFEGAAAGAFLGPTGAAVGALIGGVSGAISGASQVFQAKDDALKSYYQDQYKNTGTRRESELGSGSTIAGGREGTRMAFNKLLGGEDEAAAYLKQVQRLAVETNYTYDEITGYTKKLLNSFESDTVLDILGELSDATAGLSLSSSDVDMFVSGLNRMTTTGKATREYLNYFDDRGLNTTEALANYLQTDQTKISGMVTKGSVSGETAVEAIRTYIQDQYGGLSADLAGTYDAMVDNLGDTMDNLNAALGNAYNDKSKEGIGEDLDAYGGWLGDAVEKMNAVIGEGKGIAENLDRQYNREAMAALVLGRDTTVYGEEQAETLQGMHTEYIDLMDRYQSGTEEDKAVIAAEIEALKGEAESLAETAYNAGDMMQGIKDVELEMIAAIRENTNALGQAGWGKAYETQQASSIGRIKPGELTPKGPGVSGGFQEHRVTRGFTPAAVGLHIVPYDNFPALLHQGERVLTARETREQDRGGVGGVQVTISGNAFSVRDESDIQNIAQALAEEIQLRLMAGPM